VFVFCRQPAAACHVGKTTKVDSMDYAIFVKLQKGFKLAALTKKKKKDKNLKLVFRARSLQPMLVLAYLYFQVSLNFAK
jgi:hypothetical protein